LFFFGEDFTRDTGLEIQLSLLVNLAFTCCRTLLGLLLFASAVAPFCEAGVLAILDGVELVGKSVFRFDHVGVGR